MYGLQEMAATRVNFAVIPYQIEREAANPCAWYGTAPFCAGSCPAGTHETARDECGDGQCCVTGYKVLCCVD